MQRKIGDKVRDARFFFSFKWHRLKVMFDLSVQALKRLGLTLYTELKLNHSNPVVVTKFENEISNLVRYIN